MNFIWLAKQRKQQETYAVWWARTPSQFVQHNIASIGLTVVTSNSIIHDTLEEQQRWTSTLKAAYWRRSHTNYMLFSRATSMLSYYSGNIPERIRQGMEIWSLDTTSVITASAPTKGWYLYGNNDVWSQLSMASQSHYWWWKVSSTRGSVNGWEVDKQVEQRSSSKKDYVKCLVGCKGNYPLGSSPKWVQHRYWSLLSTIRSRCSKTPGKARYSLFFAW